jgi:hypothetical protein
VIQNNQGGAAIYTGTNRFDVETPGAGDVLAAYTCYGDTNLDGKVDGSDYSRIDAGCASGGKMTGWFNGDFNHDGVIDSSKLPTKIKTVGAGRATVYVID